MVKQAIKFLFIAILILPGTILAQDVNEFKGRYIGSEILAGGTTVSAGSYRLVIKISAKGKITITDIEGISGSGKLKGNYFKVIRSRFRQIFEGTISDGVITGTTWGNKYTGDGTFSAKLEE